MKYVIFEENKQIACAEFISQTQDGNHFYISLPSGKQAKIKAKDVFYKLLTKVSLEKIEDIDLQLLWECAPNESIHAKDLANEYFGEHNEQNIYSIFQAIQKNPIFFSKKGQGFYQKANQEQLNIALQAIEKRKIQDELQNTYAEELILGKLPETFKKNAIDLLFKPNKNSIEWKALEIASKKLNKDTQRLLIDLKAIENAKIYHEQTFFREFFPQGINFKECKITIPIKYDELEDNTHLDVFSIDDSSTIEIDDAFSVEFLENGFNLGIHIAAPALGININDEIDKTARQRLSTIYFPHRKITMLPDNIVQEFTLSAEKEFCPAISLYIKIDNAFNFIEYNTKINKIKVNNNVRYDKLEDIITQDALKNNTGEYIYKKEIALLWDFSNHLYEQRQIQRHKFGLKTENNNQIDYSFNIYEEDGIEKVKLKKRSRGSPLDKIVSELMILANSTWAKQLDEVGLNAMYRTQKSWGIIRTKMESAMSPHEGLGVEGYIWGTSPLRRYSDLVNQWQLVAFAQHRNTAKLIAPFNQKDNELLFLINLFSETYSLYHEYQSKMERYWCIKWLEQENIKYVEGILGKDGNIRFINIPFSVKKIELAQHPRGSIISLEINELDDVNLDAKIKILSINAPQEY